MKYDLINQALEINHFFLAYVETTLIESNQLMSWANKRNMHDGQT